MMGVLETVSFILPLIAVGVTLGAVAWLTSKE
jgi:hypothetical protein